MLGIIVTASILFVLLVLYYNVSKNPDFFKIKKKEKKTVVKDVNDDYIDPDLIPKQVSLKKTKEIKEENTVSAPTIQVNKESEKIVEDPISFEDDEEFDESLFTKDAHDDLFMGMGIEDENEILEEFNYLSPKMKVMMLTDILKRKEW